MEQVNEKTEPNIQDLSVDVAATVAIFGFDLKNS